MNIGLDYDGTYTVDPAFWDHMILEAMARGHTVVIMTARQYSPGHSEPRPPCMIYCTDGAMKMPWAKKNGIVIDIWIDNHPWMIGDDPWKTGIGSTRGL